MTSPSTDPDASVVDALPRVVDVMMFEIGEHAFVIDGVKVGRVFERGAEGALDQEEPIDAARLLGLQAAQPEQSRALVRIDCRGGSYLLQLDARVSVRHMDRELFRRLPAAIAGVGEATAVIGTVEIEAGYAFVLDPERLLELSRG